MRSMLVLLRKKLQSKIYRYQQIPRTSRGSVDHFKLEGISILFLVSLIFNPKRKRE